MDRFVKGSGRSFFFSTAARKEPCIKQVDKILKPDDTCPTRLLLSNRLLNGENNFDHFAVAVVVAFRRRKTNAGGRCTRPKVLQIPQDNFKITGMESLMEWRIVKKGRQE